MKLNHNGSPFTNDEILGGSGRWEVGGGRWEVGPKNVWKVGLKNSREMGI